MKYLILLLILPTLIFAQNYTAEQLIDIGLQNNYGIQQSEASYQVSKAKLNIARWDILPELSANFNYTHDFEAAQDPNSNALSLRLAKKISLNDQSYYQNKYAKYDLETAEIKLDNDKKDFVFKVLKAYIDVLNKQKQLELQNKNLEIQQSILTQSRMLLVQKKNTEFDVKQSEINLLNVQIAIKSLENDIKNSRRNLFNMLNIPDEFFAFSEITVPDFDNLPEFDVSQVPELVVLKRDIERDEIALTQSKVSFVPDLTMSYQYSKTKSGYDFEFDNNRTGHTLALDASYSFWNLFKHGQEHSQTKLSQKIKKLNYENSKLTIESQYSQYQTQLDYLKEMDELYQLKKENTQDNLNIAEQKHELGMIQQIELDKAIYEFLDASINAETNKYKLIELYESINYLLSKKLLNKY
ncbi:MAG TPA: TolC family protein [Candidatus Cloacimonadota bacterium]|jgi:outer membrane protein|nr:TolC family protein [Candidatus Cloacimonadales bacterium]HPY97382.1 TolC family protein [Candidatus Cloacimonadota bacterium]HQB41895.1 TolC family protein [Candidatus Cloacimonadota bacterium]